MSIAKTIAQQIGARALGMMGAKQLVARESGLVFKLGSGARHPEGGSVSHVQIDLDPSDTYTVTFLRVNMRAKDPVKVLEQTEGVYCDMLHDVIETGTGFYLSL